MRMFTQIRHFLAAPVFEDEDKTRVAGLLNTILLAVLALSVMYGIASLFVYPDPVPVLAFIGIVVLLGLGALSLMRSGRVRFACVSLSFVLWGIVTLGVFDFGGVRGPSFSGYFVVILIAGLLLGGRVGIAFAGLSIVAGLGMLYAETSGILPPSPIPITPASTWTLMTAILVLAAVLLYLATRGLNDALEHARRNERAVAESNRKLQLEITELAQAEEALRQGEAKYRNLLENIPQKVFYKDKDSIYVTINPSYARDFGLEPADFVGRTDFDFFPRELAEKYRADDKRIMDAGVTEELDESYVRQKEQRTVHTLKTPVRDGQGNIVGILGISWDVTERKQAEEALRVSEERFALAVQGSSDGLWDWDIQNSSLYWSPRLKELLGYADDELDVDFETFDSHLHPDDRERMGAAIEAHLKDRGSYDVEQRLRTKSGEYRWFRARGQALWDDAGNPLRMIGFTTDITERKRAEEALKTYARIQAALFQLSTDLAAALDEADICRKVVRGLHDTLGYDYLGLFLVDQSTGERVLQASIGWPDAPSNWRIPPGHGLSERPLLDGQLHYTLDVTGDPRYIPGLNSGAEVDVPLRIGEKVLGVLVVESEQPNGFDQDDFAVLSAAANQAAIAIENARLHTDTQRQLQEQIALREAGAVITSTLDLADVLSRIVQQMGQAIDVTSAYICSCEPETMAYTVLAEYVGPQACGREQVSDLGATYVQDDIEFLETMEAGQHDISHIGDPDLSESERAHMQQYGAQTMLYIPLRIKGRLVGVTELWESRRRREFTSKEIALCQGVAQQAAIALENARLYEQAQQEIAERKRAEEQLRRYAAELEQSNEELKAFAYTASHDLRAPLVNLRGFAAELRAALAVIGSAMIIALPHLDEKRQPAVTKVLQEDIPEALGFIDSSVTHMHSLTKALSKLSRLGRRELKFEPVDMGALVQATLQTLARRIEEGQVKVTVGRLPEVMADRTSMEQVMSNLLNNAVLYLDPDRAGEIEITAERDHDETTFRVRDNGRGIAEEDMDKVFAPFRRAGRQDVPGEGMGLPYVQTLVRRHGGRIWCESQPGKGSTFYFTIPANVKSDS
jgi:PAS domain S-box-containing protein